MCVVLCKRKMVRTCIFFSLIIKDRKWIQLHSLFYKIYNFKTDSFLNVDFVD